MDKIYGFKRVLRSTSSVLERTHDAIGATTQVPLDGSDIIDDLIDMDHALLRYVKILDDGKIVYEGMPDYDAITDCDWMVEVSKFYIRQVLDEEAGTLAESIAFQPTEGYIPHVMFAHPTIPGEFIDKVYIGRYKTAIVDGKATSRAWVGPDGFASTATHRAAARAKGDYWQLTDYTYHDYIMMMYKIRYANLASATVFSRNTGNMPQSTTTAYGAGIDEANTNRILLRDSQLTTWYVGSTMGIFYSTGPYPPYDPRPDRVIALGRQVTEIYTSEYPGWSWFEFDGEPVDITTKCAALLYPQAGGKHNIPYRYAGMFSGDGSGGGTVRPFTFMGIEDIFGSFAELVDGVIVDKSIPYTAQLPYQYASTLTNDYTPLGVTLPDSSAVRSLELTFSPDNTSIRFPADRSGSSSNAYRATSAIASASNTLRAVYMGGRYSASSPNTSIFGVNTYEGFEISSSGYVGYLMSYRTTRLMYKPLPKPVIPVNYYDEETTATMAMIWNNILVEDFLIDSYNETWESEASDEFRIGCFPSRQITFGLDMNLVRDKLGGKPNMESPFQINWNITHFKDGEEYLTEKPGGVFIVESMEEEYNGFAKFTLYDRAILSDVPYDFTKLNYEAGTTTIAQVEEISNHLGYNVVGYEHIKEKPVMWYDNTLSVRTHLAYIAELSGCNVYMTHNDELRFSPVRQEDPQVVMPLEFVVDEFEIGDTVTFTNVLWNNGLVEYTIGDTEAGSTLYVSANNPYVDSADDIEHIYSMVQGLTIANVKTMKAFGNPEMDIFDRVELVDQGFHYGYIMVNAMDMSFSQAFSHRITSSIQNENYERIANYFGKSDIKRIQIQVDANKQMLYIVSQKTDEVSTKVGQLSLDYNEFKTTYREGLVTDEGMSAYVGTQISQSASEIRFTFEQAMADLDGRLSGDLSDYEDYVRSFISFVNGQITLGNNKSDYELVIANDGITITDKGAVVTYFNSEKMFIAKAEITHSAKIGIVELVPDEDGSMSIRKAR